MPTNQPHNPGIAIDDPAELDRFLAAYRPTGVDASTWLPVADEAVALVRRAGALKRLRVEKDIQTLGALMAHLVERGRPATLEEALSDAALLSYDTALQAKGAGKRTVENKRGILRRLQSTHRGLPWRERRRADGDRIHQMVQPSAVAELHALLVLAEARFHADEKARALLDAVARARTARLTSATGAEAAERELARRFAQRHGLRLTQSTLRAIVTHEVLKQPAPIAVQAALFSLTRRDLDLALTYLPELSAVPYSGDHDLLRGTSTTSAPTST